MGSRETSYHQSKLTKYTSQAQVDEDIQPLLDRVASLHTRRNELARTSALYTSQAEADEDPDIQHLLTCIASLRTLRNGLALISALPPEILGEVFWYCMPQTPFVQGGYAAAMRFVLICRLWWEVAQSQPWLWTDVHCTSAALTELFLTRSRSLPIDLHIGEWSSSQGLGWGLAHVSRARTVDFKIASHLTDTTGGDLEERVLRLLSEPAPLLTSLRIQNQTAYPVINLPEDLFGHQTPMLRHLFIQGCTFNWKWLTETDFTSSLAELIIRGCRSLSAFTAHELCQWLARMPLLERLWLDFTGAQNPIAAPDTMHGPLTLLPHLKSLTVTGQLPVVLALLKPFLLPPEAVVDIKFAAYSEPGLPAPETLDMSPLMDLLARHSGGPSSVRPLRKVDILSELLLKGGSKLGRCRVVASRASTDAPLPLLEPRVTVNAHYVGFSTTDVVGGVRGYFSAVSESLSLADVESVQLNLRGHVHNVLYDGPLRAMFSSAKSTTSLTLEGRAIALSLGWLKDVDDELFPALRQLTLRAVDFREKPKEEGYHTEVIDVVNNRAGRLSEVRLEKCINLTEGDVEEARRRMRVPADIVWDGEINWTLEG